VSVTDAEYAMLSNAVYQSKYFISPKNYGFTRVKEWGDDETGFYGEVYQRDKDLVMVFRGSTNALNAKHDVQWGIKGTPPPELGSAKKFYDKIMENYGDKGLSISMTGHSLGASALQYVDASLFLDGKSQVPGVAFAPAGVADLFPQIPPISIAVRNYIRKGDIVPGIMSNQLGYETMLLPSKNESYEVQYKNGIGEIVGTRGEAGFAEQHSILGYWVDIGGLKTRTIYMSRDYYSSVERMQSGFVVANMESDKKDTVSLPDTFSFNSNLLFNQSGMKDFRIPDSHYFQLPKQQLQDAKNIAYLEKQSFNSDDGIGYSDNIILQIGDRSYRTESYMGDTA